MKFLFTTILLLGLIQGVHSQPTKNSSEYTSLKSQLPKVLVSADFKDAPLENVFQILDLQIMKSTSNLHYNCILFSLPVVGNALKRAKSKGTGITIQFKNAPLDQALTWICANEMLKWKANDDFIVIYSQP